jgi:hypothetical protein
MKPRPRAAICRNPFGLWRVTARTTLQSARNENGEPPLTEEADACGTDGACSREDQHSRADCMRGSITCDHETICRDFPNQLKVWIVAWRGAAVTRPCDRASSHDFSLPRALHETPERDKLPTALHHLALRWLMCRSERCRVRNRVSNLDWVRLPCLEWSSPVGSKCRSRQGVRAGGRRAMSGPAQNEDASTLAIGGASCHTPCTAKWLPALPRGLSDGACSCRLQRGALPLERRGQGHSRTRADEGREGLANVSVSMRRALRKGGFSTACSDVAGPALDLAARLRRMFQQTLKYVRKFNNFGSPDAIKRARE